MWMWFYLWGGDRWLSSGCRGSGLLGPVLSSLPPVPRDQHVQCHSPGHCPYAHPAFFCTEASLSAIFPAPCSRMARPSSYGCSVFLRRPCLSTLFLCQELGSSYHLPTRATLQRRALCRHFKLLCCYILEVDRLSSSRLHAGNWAQSGLHR